MRSLRKLAAVIVLAPALVPGGGVAEAAPLISDINSNTVWG